MGKFQLVFKALRIKAGLTQEEIADRLNVSRSAVGMWEQGKREPDIETLELIADFFNVDMNALTGKADEEYIENLRAKQIARLIVYNEKLSQLFDAAKDLSEDKINTLIDLVSKMK